MITFHCGNCHHSTATGKVEKPLLCGSKAGKKQFGSKAGSDECAIACNSFLELTNFSTRGLNPQKEKAKN